MMKGLTVASLKKHYALIPLFVILGGGMLLSAAYLARIAIKSPEVSWKKKANPEPWQDYDGKRYKLLQIKDIDYNEAKRNRPEF